MASAYSSRSHFALALAFAVAGALGACKPSSDGARNDAKWLGDDAGAGASASALGNVEHGEALVKSHECARCHEGLTESAKPEKACVNCHERIMTGDLSSSPQALVRWQPIVKDLRYAPALEDLGRFKSTWLVSFLQKPHDLRPALTMTMPRLAISEPDARDIAAYLKNVREPTPATSAAVKHPTIERGDAEKGKVLIANKGCMVCHRMTGVAAIAAAPLPIEVAPAKLARALVLAPDLRFARTRMTPAMLAAWIKKPSDVKLASDMPDLPMTDQEARDIATFLITTPLAPEERAVFNRLPALARPVKFDEVNEKVFHKTCWHCHSEPDYAIGDGGPGNSGGFGFVARGVDLSSFSGVLAGFLEYPKAQAAGVDAGGPKRVSLFAKTSDGTPRLLAALVARHAEQNDAPTGEVRGMPLGLPALPAEEIQLVESWIAQGRPR